MMTATFYFVLCLLGNFAFYIIGHYYGKRKGVEAALEFLRGKLTWAKSINAHRTYRTLWPEYGYTSEDDAHEAGFYAGYNAKERSAEEICAK